MDNAIMDDSISHLVDNNMIVMLINWPNREEVKVVVFCMKGD